MDATSTLAPSAPTILCMYHVYYDIYCYHIHPIIKKSSVSHAPFLAWWSGPVFEAARRGLLSLALNLSVPPFYDRSHLFPFFSMRGRHATTVTFSLCLPARSPLTQAQTW